MFCQGACVPCLGTMHLAVTFFVRLHSSNVFRWPRSVERSQHHDFFLRTLAGTLIKWQHYHVTFRWLLVSLTKRVPFPHTVDLFPHAHKPVHTDTDSIPFSRSLSFSDYLSVSLARSLALSCSLAPSLSYARTHTLLMRCCWPGPCVAWFMFSLLWVGNRRVSMNMTSLGNKPPWRPERCNFRRGEVPISGCGAGAGWSLKPVATETLIIDRDWTLGVWLCYKSYDAIL